MAWHCTATSATHSNDSINSSSFIVPTNAIETRIVANFGLCLVEIENGSVMLFVATNFLLHFDSKHFFYSDLITKTNA